MRNCASFRITAVRIAVSLVLAGIATAASADTLLIDRVQREAAVERPTRGMTMSQVRARFGEPKAELGTVGGASAVQPPITRWAYDGYIVYFEHDHVVYSVPERTTAYEQGPKPVE
jgi:hypothetical protein